MKREFLQGLGLEAEAIDKVMAEHGKTISSLKSESGDIAALKTEIEEKDKIIADRDKQLTNLGKKAKAGESLEEEIKNLSAQNKLDAEAYEKRISDMAKDHALDFVLTGKGAINPKAVKALLDMNSIKYDGKSFTGLDEQITNLIESDANQFKIDADTGGGGNPAPEQKKVDPAQLSDEEYFKQIEKGE